MFEQQIKLHKIMNITKPFDTMIAVNMFDCCENNNYKCEHETFGYDTFVNHGTKNSLIELD